MRYEDTIKRICGDDWNVASIEERDGGYGVACVMAVLDGANSNTEEIAYTLLAVREDEEPSEEAVKELAKLIEVPYRRLGASGIFSKRFNLRRDKCLNGFSTPHDGRTAWCHIAGIASGYIGQGYYIAHPSTQKANEKSQGGAIKEQRNVSEDHRTLAK